MKINLQIINFRCTVLTLLLALPSFAQFQTYKKGLAYFERGEFDLAVRELQKVKTIAPEEQARLNYTIAEAYRQSNRWAEALPFYEKAIDAKTNEPNALFHYAFALKSVGNYSVALQQIEQYIASKPTNKVFLEKALRESNTLKIIDEIRKNSKEIELVNLSKINTKGSEFSPMIWNDYLVFTASKKAKIFSDGLPFVGLYKARLGANVQEMGSPEVFNNAIFADDRNEGSPTFSPDGKTLIFARGNSGKRKDLSPDIDLYLSRFDGNLWTEPRLISASDSAAWDGSPAFSRDGKTLYFSSNRAGGSGGLDLWRVNMDASGRFGNPANMGKDINTAGDEMFPYVSEEGKLYFASDGHSGLGKLDLFMAVRSGGKITIENLGLPYNSVADDFGLSIDKKGNTYFASNRAGGQGNDDIYVYELPQKNELAELKPLDPEKVRLDSLAKLAEIKRVNYFLAGNIITQDDNNVFIPLDSAKVSISDNSNNSILAELKTDEKGYFLKTILEEGKDYSLVVEKNGYLTKREVFSMAGRAIPLVLLKKAVTDTTFLTTIQVDKMVLGKSFRLENIYYDLDKADIRTDAAIELDKLVQILNDNPNIKIELSSHTDSRSSDIYNLRLSQKRAEAAVNYILSKGIDTERLVARGYGESQLIVPNAKTETEHQINRRTEFKVTEVME